eukprot:5023223-Prymnesium_polylepis.1
MHGPARTLATADSREESLDVTIVGGGIGGVALALALARNNHLQSTAHHGVRCTLCGALCGADFDARGTRRGMGRPLTANEYLAHRMRKHHDLVHADRQFEECFPGQRSRSSRALLRSQCAPLTVRAFEKDT